MEEAHDPRPSRALGTRSLLKKFTESETNHERNSRSLGCRGSTTDRISHSSLKRCPIFQGGRLRNGHPPSWTAKCPFKSRCVRIPVFSRYWSSSRSSNLSDLLERLSHGMPPQSDSEATNRSQWPAKQTPAQILWGSISLMARLRLNNSETEQVLGPEEPIGLTAKTSESYSTCP